MMDFVWMVPLFVLVLLAIHDSWAFYYQVQFDDDNIVKRYRKMFAFSLIFLHALEHPTDDHVTTNDI